MENNEYDEAQSRQIALASRAYKTGMLRAKLEALKVELNMGKITEALAKLLEAIRFMDSEIIIEFYPSKEQEDASKE
jgi:hypothetical protein